MTEFWKPLPTCDELGATPWEALELEQQVTDCLCEVPPDIDRAESLTALAMLLLARNSQC